MRAIDLTGVPDVRMRAQVPAATVQTVQAYEDETALVVILDGAGHELGNGVLKLELRSDGLHQLAPCAIRVTAGGTMVRTEVRWRWFTIGATLPEARLVRLIDNVTLDWGTVPVASFTHG